METITIAGREWKRVGESTLEHDFWTMRQIRLCGLDEVTIAPGETGDAFAQRILMRAAADANVFNLLGGLLMPAGTPSVKWTPEMAAQTGRTLGAVTSLTDKAAVRGEIAGALASFFGQGLASLRLSSTSSPSAESLPSLTGDAISTENGPA